MPALSILMEDRFHLFDSGNAADLSALPLRRVIDACLAVHRRFGPDASRIDHVEALVRELGKAGFEISARRFLSHTALAGEAFDLAVESRLAVKLANLSHPDAAVRAVESRLARTGYAAGLIVDFHRADLIADGLWLVKPPQAKASHHAPPALFSTGMN